jgi:hypothetical protein
MSSQRFRRRDRSTSGERCAACGHSFDLEPPGPYAIATQVRGRTTQDVNVFGLPVNAARPAIVDLITYSYASRMVFVALPESYDARLLIPSW